MNPRIPKLKEERDRLQARLSSMEARLQALDEQILELENTDIVGIVRETGLSIHQLALLMGRLEAGELPPFPEGKEEA